MPVTRIKNVFKGKVVSAGTAELSAEIPMEHVDGEASLEVDVGGGGGGTGAFRVKVTNSGGAFLVPAGKGDILTEVSGSQAISSFTVPPGAKAVIEAEETGASNDMLVSAWVAVRSSKAG